MDKNVRLADIYIKIYNKRPLTLEDLTFLAKFDRECFEKTCQNLFYNLPEAKEFLAPELPDAASICQPAGEPSQAELPLHTEQKPSIQTLLENLKKMEWEEFPVPDMDAGKVKNLLGSLYMEMLFPHNDKCRYFQLEEQSDCSIFNRKA